MGKLAVEADIVFGERVSMALFKNKKSRRWLIDELEPFGVKFTDTKLSNRINGVNDFSGEEMTAIEELFKKFNIAF